MMLSAVEMLSLGVVKNFRSTLAGIVTTAAVRVPGTLQRSRQAMLSCCVSMTTGAITLHMLVQG